MRERYGDKGARMVNAFAISNAQALVGESSSALGRKDPATARRALSCAVAHLDSADFPANGAAGANASREAEAACPRTL
jgi:hypothetical protein